MSRSYVLFIYIINSNNNFSVDLFCIQRVLHDNILFLVMGWLWRWVLDLTVALNRCNGVSICVFLQRNLWPVSGARSAETIEKRASENRRGSGKKGGSWEPVSIVFNVKMSKCVTRSLCFDCQVIDVLMWTVKLSQSKGILKAAKLESVFQYNNGYWLSHLYFFPRPPSFCAWLLLRSSALTESPRQASYSGFPLCKSKPLLEMFW